MGDRRLGGARLSSFARRLQGTTNYRSLTEACCEELEATLGYKNAGIYVFDDDPPQAARVVAFVGPREPIASVAVATVPMDDALLQAVVASEVPIVVEDARTDPRSDPRLLAATQLRTMVSIPLWLIDKPFGILVTGTFDDEGVRVPTEEELEYLMALASHVTLAAARIHFQEERVAAEAERADIERRLAQRQRLESLGLLAGGIAHDFNNLLMVIMGAASLLERAPLDARQHDNLEMLNEAARGARDLTTQLLLLGRKQPLTLQPIDLNERVRTVGALVRRVLPSNVVVDLLEGQRLPTLDGDPSQIERVLLNLCLNSRDAMPHGGRLTIETEQVVLNGEYIKAHPWAKAGRYALLTVTDTGVGMTPEVVERIFEPFFTTKEVGSGSGLGLAIAYGIVRQHGGMIHCYSEPGVGTTFKVYFPVHLRRASEVGTKLDGPVPGGNERILFAEDHKNLRTLLADVLAHAGYHVVAAANGAEAVAAAEREPFDLVLLDSMMPVMGGREAFEAIRRVRPEARFLFTSGYGSDALPAEFLRDLGVRLIPKPIDPDTLLRLVRSTLDGEGARPAR